MTRAEAIGVGPDEAEFATVLRRRLDGFFAERGVRKGAGGMMTAKIVLGLAAFAASYAALCTVRVGAWGFVGLFVLHGFTQLFLLLNVAHDSNHNAISPRRLVNKPLTYVFDLCGISSYMWRILHNRGHHPNINVRGADEDVIGRGYLRFTPRTPRKALHRHQHLYAWLLYGLSTFDYVFVKDAEYFFFTAYRPLRHAGHPPREVAVLVAGKLFYLTYMFAGPVALAHRPFVLVLTAFLAMHFAIGLTAQLIFQTTHVIDGSGFPSAKVDFQTYTAHVLATTADYATGSVLAKWLLGGLNHHVAHHLCPNVCHTHYPELTAIVRETASQYQVPYRQHATMRQAIVAHFALLKRLGSAP